MSDEAQDFEDAWRDRLEAKLGEEGELFLSFLQNFLWLALHDRVDAVQANRVFAWAEEICDRLDGRPPRKKT